MVALVACDGDCFVCCCYLLLLFVVLIGCLWLTMVVVYCLILLAFYGSLYCCLRL